MRGIYQIKNLTNNKFYIGESLNILQRWEEHKKDLRNNKHHSFKLQKAWNEYGEKAFEFNILAILNDDISNFIDKYVLIVYEYLYMIQYNTLENGYNIENTYLKIKNGEKHIYSNMWGNKDSGVLKTIKNRIKKKEIVLTGGIIHTDSKSLIEIANELKIDKRIFKKLLVEIGLYQKMTNRKIDLNKDAIKEENICSIKRNYTDLKINNDTYNQIKEKIENALETKVLKQKKNQNLKNENIDIKTIEVNNYSDGYCSMKEFYDNNYIKDKYEISYVNFFKILRDNNILKYVMIDDKKYNVNTEEYKDFFNVSKVQYKDRMGLKLYINHKGREFLKNKIPFLVNN